MLLKKYERDSQFVAAYLKGTTLGILMHFLIQIDVKCWTAFKSVSIDKVLFPLHHQTCWHNGHHKAVKSQSTVRSRSSIHRRLIFQVEPDRLH